MKKFLFILILIAFFNTNAQQIEVGFTTGTGAIYMIENRDKSIDLNYAAPIIVAADIKFTPENAYFGIKLKYQNINGSLQGDNWQRINSQSLFVNKFDGYIENSSFLVLLEHINQKSKLNIGYNFGIGQTNERINFDKKGLNKIENNFFILNLGGLIKYNLNSKTSLKFEPSFQWNDPINTLYSERYKMGGEDINLLFQFGISYKLK